jgi:hypothetical protein
MAEVVEASVRGEVGHDSSGHYASGSDASGQDAVRQGVAMPRSLRRLLWLGAFAGLVAAFSFAPAIQGLSLAADGERPPAESSATAADALAAAQAEALAARP